MKAAPPRTPREAWFRVLRCNVAKKLLFLPGRTAGQGHTGILFPPRRRPHLPAPSLRLSPGPPPAAPGAAHGAPPPGAAVRTRPRGPILGARADVAPTSPPVQRRYTAGTATRVRPAPPDPARPPSRPGPGPPSRPGTYRL